MLLQWAANIAVIALCCVVGWLALGLRSAGQSPARAETYAVGDSVAAVGGIDFKAFQTTLLMVLREDCHFCQESMPFYRKLTDARAKQSISTLGVVVASTDQPKSMATYLNSNGIHVDRVVGITSGELKVPGTPSLLLVDSSGRVLRVWRGRLTATQETEVLKILGTGPTS